jgi:hypothetical protein
LGLSSQQVAQLAGYSSLNSLERFRAKAHGQRRPQRRTKRSLQKGQEAK